VKIYRTFEVVGSYIEIIKKEADSLMKRLSRVAGAGLEHANFGLYLSMGKYDGKGF
jgi:hypothetical protein